MVVGVADSTEFWVHMVYSLQWIYYIKVIVETDLQQNSTNSACLIDIYQAHAI